VTLSSDGPLGLLRFRLAYIGLALNAAVGIATAVALPYLNRTFGLRCVWLMGEVILALGMLVTYFTGPRHMLTLFVASFTGFSLATHSTNIYGLVQELVGDAGTEAYQIALANNCMVGAQIIVGIASGAVVQFAGGGEHGITALFSGSGVAALVLFSVICNYNARI
jgi:hypothetical protein